jgi:predicted transcriptional regulator
MASSTSGLTALLSIRPPFADAILEGRKRVEFRRSRFGQQVSRVVVYATRPVSAVVAVFSVGCITEGAPSSLWRQFHEVGGIDRVAFDNYYEGARHAFAIGIENVSALPEALPLETLRSGLKPPQSYCYLHPTELERAGLAFPYPTSSASAASSRG